MTFMTTMQTARKSPRQRTLNGGRLCIATGGTIECVIRDVSAEGCKVRLSQPTPLPATLELLMTKTGMIYPAEVRWNKGGEAGLAFTGPARQM